MYSNVVGSYFIPCPKYFIFSELAPKSFKNNCNTNIFILFGKCTIPLPKCYILSELPPKLLLHKANSKRFRF